MESFCSKINIFGTMFFEIFFRHEAKSYKNTFFVMKTLCKLYMVTLKNTVFRMDKTENSISPD